MKILLNGEHAEIENSTTLSQIAESKGLSEMRYAIEVNEEIIPRSEHPTHALSEGDKVEIVTAIGGG